MATHGKPDEETVDEKSNNQPGSKRRLEMGAVDEKSSAKRVKTGSGTSGSQSNGNSSVGKKKTRVVESDTSDSEENVPLGNIVKGSKAGSDSSKPKTASSTKPAVKSKTKDDEDSEDSSDDDEEDIPLMTYRRPGRRTISINEDEEDFEDDDDDDDDGDDDYTDDDFVSPRKKPRRKVSRTSSKSSSSSRRSKSQGALVGSAKVHDPGSFKVRDAAPLHSSGPPNRWWNKLQEGVYKKEKQKWKTLEHNAVVFPPPYKPHGVKMKYDGQNVELTPEQEEVATFFAVMMETDHAKKKVFQNNFFKCWQEKLGKKHIIQKFDKCDFRPIYNWAMEQKEIAKEERKQNRAKIKEEKEKLMEIYGYALVDGYREKVGNFRVEPPGLFRGRGEHPKTGLLKQRVMPEQITLNIGKDVPIPKCPIPGHNWRGIVHNPNVTWLAYWIDNINGDYKYVWLASSSKFKGVSDFLKYEKSRALKRIIDKIRNDYIKNFKSKNRKQQELGVATYLIDKLALRVGNEKDTEETADTVGCLSLRAEHLTFLGDNKINFHFLGKDSMVYNEDKIMEYPEVYENLKCFYDSAKKEKDKQDQMIFQINPTELNDYLKQYMDGLSAKVFRTYNASYVLQQELDKKENDIAPDTSIADKSVFYNECNKEVAILCNHQRSIPAKHHEQIEKMESKIKEKKDKLNALADHIDSLRGEKKKKAKKEKVKKEKKKDEDEEEKDWKFSTNLDVAERQFNKLLLSIENLEAKKTMKDATKTVALGTSKINYMDPRITVAWCKRKQMPIEKVFPASLVVKFPWAMEVPSTWKY
mmetsp:Transcript_15779/g.38918  ORF Transcript_15779/g.38918 Transcript_15779/m.38918 type:complete len:808 (-) Transcript_15779:249-2672(-)